jgi:hypothetical protein
MRGVAEMPQCPKEQAAAVVSGNAEIDFPWKS